MPRSNKMISESTFKKRKYIDELEIYVVLDLKGSNYGAPNI